jgi:hypothetical protein
MPRIPDPALRALFEHPDLSLAAKGALAVILIRPSGARVSPKYLFSPSGDPMTVVSKAVRELARTGLVGTAKAGRAGGGVRSLMAIGPHRRPGRQQGRGALLGLRVGLR